jgi:hypothetical protein
MSVLFGVMAGALLTAVLGGIIVYLLLKRHLGGGAGEWRSRMDRKLAFIANVCTAVGAAVGVTRKGVDSAPATMELYSEGEDNPFKDKK